ncbi:MAG: hypothetical protein V4614_05285 [Pseudomonadota bacterium]
MANLISFIAMLGINLVLCAALASLLCWKSDMRPWMGWVVALFFTLLWVPLGTASLPVVAYIRGVSSDLSSTLVLLATVGLGRRIAGLPALAQRERLVVYVAAAAAAVVLYPTALGWGDHDAYRLGWGSPLIWLILLAVCAGSWFCGFRLLPLLIAAGLLAWAVGLMESGNLWDYLLDPWLAVTALLQCVFALIRKCRGRQKPLAAMAAS